MQKTAFVTGASSGIGSGIVKKLAEAGYVVAGFDRNDATVEGCAKLYVGDVTDYESLAAALADFAAAHGKINCLVPNAGIIARNTLAAMPLKDIERMIAINVLGPILTCRAAIPHMAKGSAIVLTGSSSSEHPTPELVAYAASKAAVDGLTKALALELGPDVRVNAIAPRFTDTELYITAGVWNHERQDALLADRGGTYPLKRTGVARDHANAVAFLASDEASWITGAKLPVDGGTHVWK